MPNRGRPKKENAKKSGQLSKGMRYLSFVMSVEDAKMLNDIAEKKGISRNALLGKIIQNYLKRNMKKDSSHDEYEEAKAKLIHFLNSEKHIKNATQTPSRKF